MNATPVLEGALDLIRDKNNWTRNYYARDTHGKAAMPDDPDAVCWCADGALLRVGSELGLDYTNTAGSAKNFLNMAISEFELNRDPLKSAWGVVSFNDTRKHEDVVAVFESAIEMSKKIDMERQNGE